MNTSQKVNRTYHPIIRGFQFLYMIIAWLFALCVACQAYLAGLGIFSSTTWLAIHGVLGFFLGDATVLMLLLVFLARFPFRIVLLNILLILDVLLQIMLVTALRALKQTALTALHPANALILFLLSLLLAYSALRWIRASKKTITPAIPYSDQHVSDLS